MKVIDLKVEKETAPEAVALRCVITLDDGSQMESYVPWHNPVGLWASPNNEREHEEICAWLRLFAKSIEDAAKERNAA